MIGLEWLRRKATEIGGPGAFGGPAADMQRVAPLVEAALCERSQQPAAEAMPVAVVEISGVVPRADEEEVRRALTVSPRPRRDVSVECGCWPRYSECRCKR